MKGFLVPKEVSERLIDAMADAVKARRLNLGLFFDKYVLWWKEGNESKCSHEVQVALLRKIHDNPQDVKNLLHNPEIAGKEFREKVAENVKLSLSFEFISSDDYESYKKRMNHLFDTLEQQMGYCIKYLPDANSGLSLNWRLIINLGAASVYETSLLLHRNYSIPYIPGSAVKGVTRHWAILKFAERIQKQKNVSYEKAIEEVDSALENNRDLGIAVDGIAFEDTIKIFGNQNKKGEVVFFDALPIIEQNANFLVVDVMNVHYKPYYEASEIELKEGKEKVPGDWHSPVPVFFLAVEKGTKFRFCVASKNHDLIEKTMALLKEAVEKIGIGAKTSAGYGYFEV